MTQRRPGRNGFTIVELLTTIGIIAALTAILIPAVNAARNSARKTGCANNMRQIGLAITGYESARSEFPVGQTWVSRRPEDAFPYAWSMSILSFLEQQQVADQFNKSKIFLEPSNLLAASTVIPTYICPGATEREEHRNSSEQLYNVDGPGNGLACIDYLGIAGPSPDSVNPASGDLYGSQRGILIGTKGLKNGDKVKAPKAVRDADVTDGLSKTACVTECTGRGLDGDGDFNGTWVSGRNVGHIAKTINGTKASKSWQKERVFSEHPGGAHFLMCDGSLQFLRTDTTKQVLKAIASRNGEEKIDVPAE